MQNGGVVRLAHSILARPCCVLQICPTSTEGMRHAWEQCFFSTSTTARHPTVSATTAESLNTSDSQRGAAGTKHAEKVVHANNLRRLRKKWQAQHAEQLAIKAKAAAKKAANIAVTQEGHRRNLAALKQLRAQIHEEKQRLQLAELVSCSFAPCCGRAHHPKSCTHWQRWSSATLCILPLIADGRYFQLWCHAGTTAKSCS